MSQISQGTKLKSVGEAGGGGGGGGGGGDDGAPMDLLQQIAQGTTLRKTTAADNPRPVQDEEPDLLAQIRNPGFALRKVDRAETPRPAAAPSQGNSIANAMEQYRRLVADSDSDSDSASDDDWSD